MYICITLQPKQMRARGRQTWTPTYWGLKGSTPPASYFIAFAWFAATDMARSLPAISVNAGRCAGSGAQHCSMSLLHSGSHDAGTGGLSVLFTMPPAKRVRSHACATDRSNKKRLWMWSKKFTRGTGSSCKDRWHVKTNQNIRQQGWRLKVVW